MFKEGVSKGVSVLFLWFDQVDVYRGRLAVILSYVEPLGTHRHNTECRALGGATLHRASHVI